MSDSVQETWPVDDLRRAFVAGAVWCEWRMIDFTRWPNDRRLFEKEAKRRYPEVGIPSASREADRVEEERDWDDSDFPNK